MPELDDEVVTVTLPAEEGGAVITKVEGQAEPKPDTADPIADLKGQFETLKSTLGQTTQRLVGAERQLAVKDQEIATVRGEVAASQLDTVVSGIAAANAEAEAAEREYVAAAEAGDFAAQARAQRKISGAEARIQRLTEAKGDLEDAKPAQRTEARPEPRQAQQDPVEAVASGMAPRAAAWIRSHPDCITDKSKNAKMMATHYAALAEGLEEGGNDYFERLDAMVNAAPAKATTPAPTPTPVADGKRPMSAAASGANTGGGMNGGGTTVTLTKREVEAATDGTHVHNYTSADGKFKKGEPIGVQEFARRKAVLIKQGAYDRTYTDS